jgi:hypothetical protein
MRFFVSPTQPPTAQPTPAPRTFCAGGVAVVTGTDAYDGNYIESSVIDDPNATSVSALAPVCMRISCAVCLARSLLLRSCTQYCSAALSLPLPLLATAACA